MLCIKNGYVMDPYTQTQDKLDILIDDNGDIIEISSNINADCDVYDAQGYTVTCGLIDTHVHFRDPGQTHKEDLQSGMHAAAAGGFTTVVCMANTAPIVDCAEILTDVVARAQGGACEILQACAVTKGLKGQEMVDFCQMKAVGAACFTDDGINLTNENLAQQAMEQAAKLDVLLSFHEEDPSMVLSPGVNFGSAAAAHFGVQGAQAQAEEVMVERDVALAQKTGAKVLFQHLSSGKTVEIIREGKKTGAKIYGEVTPHHLYLTQDDVIEHGTYARMNPPLRTEADRKALILGLCDGTLDVIATDHAPHTTEEKSVDFAKAPSGITGLETAFSVCNTALVHAGHMSRMELLEKMSRNPAQIYGLTGREIAVGNRARLSILDWECEMVYETYASKSSNTPFTGKKLVGKPIATVLGDKVQK